MSALVQRSILLGLLVIGALAAHAQQGGEYVIQGIFNPTIADAQKKDLRPEPIDTILPERPVKFDVLPVKAAIPSKVDSLAAVRLDVKQSQQKLYKGFVKAGFGLYLTPLGELYYDQARSRDNAWGIHLKHLSSAGGLSDVGSSRYSYNNVDAYYNHFLRNHEVSGRLMYDRRRVSYYGYEATDSVASLIDNTAHEQDDLKQLYNDIGFAARVRSLYKDSTLIAHDVGLEVHAYSNLSGSRETNVRLTADLSKAEQGDRLGLGILIDNNAYRGELRNGLFGEVRSASLGDLRTNGTLIGLTPSITREGDKYMVRIGAGVYIDAQGKTSFHFYPRAYASYSLFEDILVPYIGITGERRRNSFRSLTRENPWLIARPALENSSLLYDVYGGLRGSVSSRVGFDVRASISAIENRPLFLSAPNAPFGDQMAVVYDKVKQFNLSGELSYRMDDAVRFHGRIDITNYDTDDEPEAWNLPPYQLALGATYSMQGKLIAKLEAQFLGQRKAGYYTDRADATLDPPVSPVTKDLNGFLDLYLGLEYRYTKRLSVFLDMSNLSASKYERWYRHPVQRGLLLGGATYSF
ncbi:MAG: hypothetical protein KF797_09580 [Flavobacteriales bacterium]|nr:hypothetical protein [Flavobacteriales bacterium]